MRHASELVARSRLRLAEKAGRLLLGSVSRFVGTGFVHSLAALPPDGPIGRHVIDVTILRKAYVDTYPLDASLPRHYRRSKAFDQRHLYRLQDTRVSPKSGLCWLPNGYVLGESFGSMIRLAGWERTALEAPLRGVT